MRVYVKHLNGTYSYSMPNPFKPPFPRGNLLYLELSHISPKNTAKNRAEANDQTAGRSHLLQVGKPGSKRWLICEWRKEIWSPIVSLGLVTQWLPPQGVRPRIHCSLTHTILIHTQLEFFLAQESMKNKLNGQHPSEYRFFFFKCFNGSHLLGCSWKMPWHFLETFYTAELKTQDCFPMENSSSQK